MSNNFYVGANVTQYAFMQAARWADLDLVKTLIAAGRMKSFLHHICERTLLLTTIMVEQSYISSYIISQRIHTVILKYRSLYEQEKKLNGWVGANVNLRKGNGETVLFEAVRGGKLDVFKSLIALGEKSLLRTVP